MNGASPSEPSTVTVRMATADDAVAVADTMLASRRAFLSYAPSAHPEPDFRGWVRDASFHTVAEVRWRRLGHPLPPGHDGPLTCT